MLTIAAVRAQHGHRPGAGGGAPEAQSPGLAAGGAAAAWPGTEDIQQGLPEVRGRTPGGCRYSIQISTVLYQQGVNKNLW